jgi:hypothetical protein
MRTQCRHNADCPQKVRTVADKCGQLLTALFSIPQNTTAAPPNNCNKSSSDTNASNRSGGGGSSSSSGGASSNSSNAAAAASKPLRRGASQPTTMRISSFDIFQHLFRCFPCPGRIFIIERWLLTRDELKDSLCKKLHTHWSLEYQCFQLSIHNTAALLIHLL